MLRAYRRMGADPPWSDPAAAHGIGMEGYYWRFTDAATRRVVVVLCGACRAPGGAWALVAVATDAGPGARRVHQAIVPECRLDPGRLGVEAGDVLRADERGLRVRLGGVALEAALEVVLPWPRRWLGGLGPAQLVPGLGQYWHPHLPLAAARGVLEVDGETWSLDGWRAYAEKNWGSRFAGHWWWGQAHDLGADAASVAFAGGRLVVGAPTALVVALEPGRVLRLAPPLAHVVTASAPGRWRVRARGPVHEVELEAEAEPGAAHVLPVPVVAERRAVARSHQHLAGRLAVVVRRGRRVLWRGETELAGLERGTPLDGC